MIALGYNIKGISWLDYKLLLHDDEASIVIRIITVVLVNVLFIIVLYYLFPFTDIDGLSRLKIYRSISRSLFALSIYMPD